MILTELSITILTLATLLAGSLQGPIQSEQGPPMNETNRIVVTESPEQSLASSGDGEVNETVTTSCPNYIPGIRNKTDCFTGTRIGSVDHWTAFGLNKGRNTDWATCGLPRVPQANERICYRTTVNQCGTDYRIYLNLRNKAGLQRNCPLESEELPTFTANGSDRYFQSPRYGCRKNNNKVYDYRRDELCLYHVSIPNCESGFLVIESSSNNTQAIETRDENGICTDYLQVFYGESATEPFCGNDLTLKLPLTIPTTQFLALFWTDSSNNEPGFKLRAKCKELREA